MALTAFGGELGDPHFTNHAECDCELDVDRAADELQQAGYKVFRLPAKYRGRVAHPLDDFIESSPVLIQYRLCPGR
jgi:hypothetical protein